MATVALLNQLLVGYDSLVPPTSPLITNASACSAAGAPTVVMADFQALPSSAATLPSPPQRHPSLTRRLHLTPLFAPLPVAQHALGQRAGALLHH